MDRSSAYDFGYSWFIGYGLLIPFALAAILAAVAAWRGWPRWVLLAAVLIAVWAAAGVMVVNVVWGINRPMTLPTDGFLSSGTGRVLDAGAGSGRAGIGVLLARPRATVVGLDIYRGYWGIDDNTPERFMLNARAAGVADRAEARTGDMREMPFPDGSFDAVISAFALDHLRREGQTKALLEIARVLKPKGEFLLLIPNVDLLTWVFSPHAVAHHPRPDREQWRALLEQHGFTVEEVGTRPATLYLRATKRP